MTPAERRQLRVLAAVMAVCGAAGLAGGIAIVTLVGPVLRPPLRMAPSRYAGVTAKAEGSSRFGVEWLADIRPASQESGARRPEGYECFAFGRSGLPARCNRRDLPLRVGSEDADRDRVFARALAAWNEAGEKIAGSPFFCRVNDRDRATADFVVEWSGLKLDPGLDGAVRYMERGDEVVIEWVSLRPMKDEARLCAVLVHELGHVLGLGHSTDPGDIMHQYTGPGDPGGAAKGRPAVGPTARDLAMARWLYRQEAYVPIRPAQVPYAP